MATPNEIVWDLAPHTQAKHEILTRCLDAWFPILNKHNQRIVYIDGFCGPGRYKVGEPGSPVVALGVAVNQRRALAGELLFWFIDKQQDRINHLQGELDAMALPGHFKVHAECGRFDEKLRKVLEALDANGRPPAPTFALVDPFGFSGMPFSLIEELLKHRRCEAFVIFMDLDDIDWVIVGGESSPGAWPMDPAWVRVIRDLCGEASVPFFFKQWGGVRKKEAGRILDGRTWDEMPAPVAQAR